MTKEEELMNFLHARVFDPILNNPNVSSSIRIGVNLTIGRMRNQRTAEKMLQYFWSAVINSIDFPRLMRAEGLTRFEDILDDFKARFNDDWLKR